MQDDEGSDDTSDSGVPEDGTDAERPEDTDAERPEDTDAERPGNTDAKRRKLALAGLGAVLILSLVGWWGPWRSDPPSAEPVSATSSTTTTTTVPPVSAVVAPLTGLPVSDDAAVRLLRPALVAKIDGALEAMPQEGLDSADVVMEVRVEGISRYLGVWHSAEVQEIGPVRSARTTDPDLLAMFGRPLFAYSGGNSGVLSALRRADWFQDVSHDAAPDSYSRSRSRRAPHNLMADTAGLWARSAEPLQFPGPVFTYRAADEPAPGEPAAGFEASVQSGARFAWDAEIGGWRRWAYGIAHESTVGEQIAPTNVVVVAVDYVTSPADRASPEAISVGSGPAWVYSDGSVQVGTWSRPDRNAGWDLRDAAGNPMTLDPGRTWVELADAAPRALGAPEAEALLASAPRPAPG